MRKEIKDVLNGKPGSFDDRFSDHHLWIQDDTLQQYNIIHFILQQDIFLLNIRILRRFFSADITASKGNLYTADNISKKKP